MEDSYTRYIVEEMAPNRSVRDCVENMVSTYTKIMMNSDVGRAPGYWPLGNSFALRAMFWTVDHCLVPDWKVLKAPGREGPLAHELAKHRLHPAVNLDPALPNDVAAYTVWSRSKRTLVISFNSKLHPYLASSGHLYYSDPSDQNHVGGINCSQTGCLVEVMVHEYCHAVEFLYRSLTGNQHEFGEHHPDDNSNLLFQHILGVLTDHVVPFNNLLHAAPA